ncbi:putative membrane protein [Desulfitobacterium dichloroeliminans LMG P-21439]|uniref:Putative membrane protein n=1 Tax=Desulfitobacterium dichloroeliminans (strain LMG P-21439 / DCA1) TaxID=871963 RepID=L0F5Z7_DESDL|nr:DUF2318 domain-containing protein [Desulfitobacterium dichloroeliminans]AGA68597.1 putative membrane protein [Desulfitobacterium dichloroeliminans LMG P-21439]
MTKENNSKREKFTQPAKKSKAPLIGGAIVLGIAIIAGGFMLGNKNSDSDQFATATVGQTVDYSGSTAIQQVKTTPVKAENGKVVVSTLSELKDKKFIYTQYQKSGKALPLTALVRPDGSIVVAVSICEPCNSDSFRIEGETIVCNACNTVWELETFKGLSGGCQDYPPELLVYTQNGDNLEVDQAVLDAWKPRV